MLPMEEPVIVTLLAPVGGVLVEFCQDANDAISYETNKVPLPILFPTVSDKRLVPCVPLATFATIDESEVQSDASQDVGPI